MRISDLRLDVCSADLIYSYYLTLSVASKFEFTTTSEVGLECGTAATAYIDGVYRFVDGASWKVSFASSAYTVAMPEDAHLGLLFDGAGGVKFAVNGQRSEEHTSELQSLMRISYAVFCLKKKKTYKRHMTHQR